MNLPQVVSREEWLAARKELLTREKAMTRAIDTLNADRRRLPMVLVDKPYQFQGPDGPVGLLDLFDGRRQLIVQHAMWLAEDGRICPGCTAGVDEMADGLIEHLRARDTTFVLVARGPLADLQRYQAERGWTIPLFSSLDSDFNYDFHVTLDESVAPVEYNYRSLAEWRAAGSTLVADGESAELPGFSCFLRDDAGHVYHTYSTYGRGTDNVGSAYDFLDLTALGRQEDWEEPKGRVESARGAVPDFAD
ncbi:MAG TPA: DUF899 domain-containing protein [Jatrophihabitans sp.]|jgi:predicted dithiol-disulfide oxidoreductase (DUF899 family)|nr:DUF899 domain-containing protein [Jatrophihabitans sp.]